MLAKRSVCHTHLRARLDVGAPVQQQAYNGCMTTRSSSGQRSPALLRVFFDIGMSATQEFFCHMERSHSVQPSDGRADCTGLPSRRRSRLPRHPIECLVHWRLLLARRAAARGRLPAHVWKSRGPPVGSTIARSATSAPSSMSLSFVRIRRIVEARGWCADLHPAKHVPPLTALVAVSRLSQWKTTLATTSTLPYQRRA